MNLDLLRRNDWCGGQLLAFSGLDGPTDFDHNLVGRTAFGSPGIDIKLPGPCRITFINKQPSLVTNDSFELGTPPVLRGAFVDTHHLLIEGQCEIARHSEQVKTISRNSRLLVGSASHFDAAKIDTDLDATLDGRRNWLEQQNVPATLSPKAQATLAKAFSVMKCQVCTAQGNIRHRWTTPARWPCKAMWLWDSIFHAIGWRHIDISMARDLLSAVLDTQYETGFIAHALQPNKTSHITQPPLLAFAAGQVYEAGPNRDWIGQIYPKLCAYVNWDLANRDSDGAGLVEWFIEGEIHCRSGESGMDNSPRFDAATQLDATDFNSYLALECQTLAHFATVLGRNHEAERWLDQHHSLCQLIDQRLWSDKYKFYVDYDVDRNTSCDVLAGAGFLPLICGAASPQQAQHLAAHMDNTQTFATAIPIPSVAAINPSHYAKDMWRGPTWAPLNWLVSFGFDRYGLHRQADDIRQKTIHEIERTCAKYNAMFEFFDDRGKVDPPALLRKGSCDPSNPYHQVFFDLGWTATIYADWVLTNASPK